MGLSDETDGAVWGGDSEVAEYTGSSCGGGWEACLAQPPGKRAYTHCDNHRQAV